MSRSMLGETGASSTPFSINRSRLITINAIFIITVPRVVEFKWLYLWHTPKSFSCRFMPQPYNKVALPKWPNLPRTGASSATPWVLRTIYYFYIFSIILTMKQYNNITKQAFWVNKNGYITSSIDTVFYIDIKTFNVKHEKIELNFFDNFLSSG